MSLHAVAGCKIYIGGVLEDKESDFVEADFSGQSWTEIDGWSQMGAFGDASEVITTALINRDRAIKQKGVANAGSMQCVFADIADDPGQIALIAAAQPSDRDNRAFRIDLNDASGGGQPSKRYFIGLVMSATEAGGEANTIRNLNSTIEINSNIVRVAAT
jgi:hypothetical protein